MAYHGNEEAVWPIGYLCRDGLLCALGFCIAW